MSDFLQTLNEPQREGVINTEGPTMIIAGAGSGKPGFLLFALPILFKAKMLTRSTLWR
jgi:DNA helicase-2/ATP-dependent DNA helicase PcrA